MRNKSNSLARTINFKGKPILKARVMVNNTSVVVQLLIANISSAPVRIENREMLAVDQCLEQHSFSGKPTERNSNKKTPVQKGCKRADLHSLRSKIKHFSRYSTNTARRFQHTQKISEAQIISITRSTSLTVVLCVRALGAFFTSKSEFSKQRKTKTKRLYG